MTYGKAGRHVQAHANEPREPTPLVRRFLTRLRVLPTC
jgi:hypothetical protein